MTLPLPAAALSQHVIILGKTGAGKSSTMRLLVEGLLTDAAPTPDLGTGLVDSIRAALNGPQREVQPPLRARRHGDRGIPGQGTGGAAEVGTMKTRIVINHMVIEAEPEDMAEAIRLAFDAAFAPLRAGLAQLEPPPPEQPPEGRPRPTRARKRQQ